MEVKIGTVLKDIVTFFPRQKKTEVLRVTAAHAKAWASGNAETEGLVKPWALAWGPHGAPEAAGVRPCWA